MPPAKTKRLGPAYDRAIGNVERMMNLLGLGQEGGLLQKEVAFAAGLSETVFSSKLKSFRDPAKRGRSHFFEDEFELIAQFFRNRTGRPLIGFPHLDWQMMELCDRKVGGWSPGRG